MRDRLNQFLGARLAWRIYLVGLAQVAAVGLGFWALLATHRPPVRMPPPGHAHYLARQAEILGGDAATLAEELRRVKADYGVSVVVFRSDDTALASNDGGMIRCERNEAPPTLPPPGRLLGEGPPPGPPHQRPEPDSPGRRHGPGPCWVLPVSLEGGAGAMHYRLDPPEPPSLALRIVPIVLLVVGIASLLLGRSLTRPLRQLSTAARAFGAGDLRARTGLARSDELGQVAVAFDEMAARIAALLRAERELLADISHELRTPLARIRVALDLATEGDAQTARGALVDIAEDLTELEEMIGDILTNARLELQGAEGSLGLPALRREPTDVGDLVERAARRFRAMHPARRLELDVSGDLPSVEVDRTLLRRVIDNLLQNAHRYTDDQEAGITLGASEVDGAVEIRVVDRGIGIPAEALDQVFRPFYRVDRSRDRATGGIGLGLALVKKVVDAHGGTVVLESRVDEGTTARVRLPLAAREGQSAIANR